ncbi:DUF368 domain-containing protein [Sporosarcina sp. P37]|uniref:DUF368 domain-containing protein n=1 Tax=unclassified Sporosarcina TaxID=2647733 RepID=UPI0009BF41B2|nr:MULTISPECIES: DUF368 domain-containing protein [unclassified Sporosarcina]ARD47149.1 DUF368 domain-containing protein [Sporosarcina sp. P33]ARK23715.1 DUF368 domain-containing protein [Sporosarcina sp. P37]PID18862.1 DUF368 domain-containing protein [Sporosarcina sp. P35]
MEWRNLYRGFLMGISDLIPGVSGGTIAFILGIYDQLLSSISGFFSKDWKKHIGFLIPLAIGMGATIILFSKVISYLLKHYHEPTQFFFLGLIIGVIPFVSKQAGLRTNFAFRHFVLILIVAAALASTVFIKPADPLTITHLTAKTAVILFFSGWAGSMAMLLPGVSGSFVLLLLGVYTTVITAISNFNIPIIIATGAGIAVGFVVSSKVIRYLLSHFRTGMFAVIIGLILGSVFVIFPGIPESGTPYVMSIIAIILGLIIANILNAVGDQA